MLKDGGQSEEFRKSKHWKSPLLDFRLRVPEKGDGKSSKSNSLSGNERNRLIMRDNDGFVDRSLVSGVDCREDARSFTLLDYDKDGWVDIALASTNGPRLRLFRNCFGDLGAKGSVVEVTLQGSSREAKANTAGSNRDAVGAILTAVTDKGSRVYRKSIGEGLAAQNSGRIRVTLAEGETLVSLSVRWPSGKLTKVSSRLSKPLIHIKE
ncbi:MAG: hypothetical protein ACJAR1_002854 [Rubritalea sp.]